jgi:hypothetical protein
LVGGPIQRGGKLTRLVGIKVGGSERLEHGRVDA